MIVWHFPIYCTKTPVILMMIIALLDLAAFSLNIAALSFHLHFIGWSSVILNPKFPLVGECIVPATIGHKLVLCTLFFASSQHSSFLSLSS